MNEVKIIRIFIIIGMIVTSIFSFLIFCPTAIIFGIKALKFLDDPNEINEKRKNGLLVLLFVSQISGILLLTVSDDEIIQYQKSEGDINGIVYEKNMNNKLKQNYIVDISPIGQLRRLKELYDNNIIDEETYNEKRNILVNCKKYL